MISILITVYNSEKYLKECLDSVQGQTYKDFEALILDDGSEDSSEFIASSYLSDSRFKYIKLDHVGFCETKNIGLQNASGDYIIFLDSDDVVDSKWLECLISVAKKENSDITVCSFEDFEDGTKIKNFEVDLTKLRTQDETSQKMSLLFYDSYLCFMWNKLIKKELYKDLRFKNVIALSDVQAMYKIFEKASSVISISNSLIHRRIHNQSMSVLTKNIEGYWEYRLDLFLNILTYIYDKYEYTHFIVKRFLNKELYKMRDSIKDENKILNLLNPNQEKINHILQPSYSCNFDVDLVVPYVNGLDPIWQKAYFKAKGSEYELANGSRFNDPGLFKYFLRGVDKFMPWIRNIYLIVSNIEQVPEEINKEKTKIVLHKDIIPEEYLPTFNSQTIEMFIHNIEGLSEHFIYSNDDMYPIGDLDKSDFFTEDGKPKIVFKRSYIRESLTIFNKVCVNNYRDVLSSLGRSYKEDSYLKPEHTMTSMLLSDCKKCFNLLWNKISPYLDPFRTSFQHNQYIYPLYSRFTRNYEFGGPHFRYDALNNSLEDLIKTISNHEVQIYCLNGVADNLVSENNLKIIKENFEANLN